MTTNRIDIAAIRARLRADRDARIDTPDGEPRCALCDGEGTGETAARRTLLEYAPADLAALCDEVERLRAENVLMREIIAGRRVPPTAAEASALLAAGGTWMFDGRFDPPICRAFDEFGALCAWPVVTEVTT